MKVEIPPTKELMARAHVVVTHTRMHGNVYRNDIQCPLDYYFHQKDRSRNTLISKPQWDAGNRLNEDWVHCPFYHTATINLNPSRDGIRETSEKQQQAWESYRKAIEAIPGKIGQLLAHGVCVDGRPVKYYTYIKNYETPEKIMARFREVLDALVEHYGIPS